MSQIERRSLPVKNLELRQHGGRAVLAGTAIVFDEWSLDLGGFVERVAPSFVDRTLDRVRRGVHRLLALWNHESSLPIGNTSSKGGLTVTKRSHGLDFELPASNLTDAQRAAVGRGDVRAVSFGFHVSKDEWEKGENGKPDRRTLIDGEIIELSPCTFPAYPQTNLLLAKRSHDAWRREQGRPSSPADDRVVLTGRELREAMRWNLNEARRTAAHEAGHVVVMLHEKVTVRGARLLWRETTNGKYTAAAGDVTYNGSSSATTASYMAGMIAEDRRQGVGWNPGKASRSDLRAVRRLDPRSSHSEWEAKETATKVLKTYHRAFTTISCRLLHEGEVSGAECSRIFDAEKARLERLGRAVA